MGKEAGEGGQYPQQELPLLCPPFPHLPKTKLAVAFRGTWAPLTGPHKEGQVQNSLSPPMVLADSTVASMRNSRARTRGKWSRGERNKGNWSSEGP